MKLILTNTSKNYDESLRVENFKPVEKSGDNDNAFTADGVFSEPIFGSLTSLEYACSCKQLSGKFNEGEICKNCNTGVVSSLSSIGRYGWINLEDVYLINPLYVYFLNKILPLNKIIGYEFNIDENGDVEEVKLPYYNIGLVEFRANFREILDYFYSQKKKTASRAVEYYDLLLKHSEKIFTNKIMIYSITLRPASCENSKLTFDEVNNFYNNILHNAHVLKFNDKIDDAFKLNLMFDMQTDFKEIFNSIIGTLSGKQGIIRNNLLGYRINFCSRMVIIPAECGHKIDEVTISYVAFMELYRFHMINLIRRMFSLTYNEASIRWSKAILKFDKEIYDNIIMRILKNGNPAVFINRNPSISFGSVLYMKITAVKKDIHDYTLSIHNNVLSLMGADYDGDVLNVIVLIDEQFKTTFSKLSPVNMLLDNNNGAFNTAISLERDQILGLYSLLTYEMDS